MVLIILTGLFKQLNWSFLFFVYKFGQFVKSIKECETLSFLFTLWSMNLKDTINCIWNMLFEVVFMLTPSISAETNKLTFDILKDLALFQKFYFTKKFRTQSPSISRHMYVGVLVFSMTYRLLSFLLHFCAVLCCAGNSLPKFIIENIIEMYFCIYSSMKRSRISWALK